MKWSSTLAVGILLAVGCDTGETSEGSTYERVESLIVESCASGHCHGGPGQGASKINFQWVLDQGKPFTAALLTADGGALPACQYDLMPLLDPGDADNSWLMVKMETAHDADGWLTFTPDATWDPGIEPDGDGNYPPSACPATSDGEINFGQVMPFNAAGGAPLSDAEIALVRTWIDDGAEVP